ncbi:twin-arginine translocase subunit TatC, partial [bacterium]|nr:twin-arginine translocase subunit TatC [bacterium]
FAFGVVLCYSILPFAFQWFASYVPKNAELRPSVQGSVIFSVKMLLVFGILFQLPIIMMLLAKIGIVSSKMLWNQWRVAVVLIATVAAIATPSNDAFSMIMAAVPMVFLYFLGIFLVKLTERKRKYI